MYDRAAGCFSKRFASSGVDNDIRASFPEIFTKLAKHKTQVDILFASSSKSINKSELLFFHKRFVMALPTIVIVPGLWLGPKPYELLEQETKKLLPSLPDFVYAPLVSTGRASPGNPNMTDDSLGVRQVIKPLVEAGKRLVLIGHSTGALVAAGSTEDLEVGEKLAAPSGGGVERFVFIVGGILPVGSPHPPMSFFRYEVLLSSACLV